MRELKPCPFCGENADVFYVDENTGYFITKCNECGAIIRRSEGEEAIEAWNTRANHWHTELPTEDGQYFVAYRWGLDNQIMHDMAKQICYGATVFSHGTWKVEFPFVVLAWQKIEPFEEREE